MKNDYDYDMWYIMILYYNDVWLFNDSDLDLENVSRR